MLAQYPCDTQARCQPCSVRVQYTETQARSLGFPEKSRVLPAKSCGDEGAGGAATLSLFA
ncbi:hypothetical protein E2C01_062452 [Portunus trituberculatus]|uniref:Uncharacterized protein n=1 Tax=Portunus trituberculatus TaxID=210409 RepID=A0A5B7HI26_PORTR|nr:hypothetical protein [Portunus trituberculatus]